MPAFTVGALVGIALPLFIVTMASQNVPGIAIMRSFGYEVPWRPAMLVTGLGTALGAPAGGHAINLAAISAALAASPTPTPTPPGAGSPVSRPERPTSCWARSPPPSPRSSCSPRRR